MYLIICFIYPYIFFLLTHLYKIHVTAVSTTNKREPTHFANKKHFQFSSEEFSKQELKQDTIDLQSKKVTKRGRLGSKIKVSIPMDEQILKRKGNSVPKHFWTKEQKIARNAKKILQKGNANDLDEALQMANDKYLHNVQQRRLKRTDKKENRKPIKLQSGHNSKNSWVTRRALGLLDEHDNGIVNREQAFKRADGLWKQRIELNRIRRMERRQKSKNQN